LKIRRDGADGDVILFRGQYSDAVLNELESQNDQQVDGIMGKVRILKDVSGSEKAGRTYRPLMLDTDDRSNRRRDQRVISISRKDERQLRQDTVTPPRHHEPDAAHGGEDRCWLEGVAWFLPSRHPLVYVCLALLSGMEMAFSLHVAGHTRPLPSYSERVILSGLGF